MTTRETKLHNLFTLLFQAHPWHGVSPGEEAPETVNVYIEIVPTDAVKYELDKISGHLRVDRPQRFSSFCPTLYGLIPQTFCGEAVAELCRQRTGLKDIKGDGDPMDICVLTEKTAAHGNFFVRARPIGGLRMIDGNDADDKIIAVLESDVVYGRIREIDECPKGLIDRLKHYFLSYKQLPNEAPRRVEIIDVYGRAEALDVIKRSMDDYRENYGEPEERMGALRHLLAH
ncbi:inorganic pyrophosphatase [Pyrinomonas methylaliphatogenes]|jgi:inorganic pyrophosphatase|uniref:Inorganic pyrophosphatase n=1 Tax=Pyrinomonas methylaliphatogenes TaxID=454194 RepID=A0A0B6WWN7_9BACT|nr:inorganic pyrophosphatase [Pyrinomonas methylaliphatogenes]MBX5478467.1 inorganic pyrophosphatase [Pyrinomonas methylaliphatogenes]CDM64694.1 inorganic pyrophosphatase [Pyrinomonas methylaliphatogenes]